MVTLLDVEYIAWSGCLTCITVELFVNTNGFLASLLPYTSVEPSSAVVSSPISSFVNARVPVEFVVKFARYNVNFISSACIAFHVELFCDLNNTPRYGCLETNLLPPPTSTCPISEIHNL